MPHPPQGAFLETVAGADAIGTKIHLDDLPFLAPIRLPGDREQLALSGIAVAGVNDDELAGAHVGQGLIVRHLEGDAAAWQVVVDDEGTQAGLLRGEGSDVAHHAASRI
jgi:hypothetical protein